MEKEIYRPFRPQFKDIKQFAIFFFTASLPPPTPITYKFINKKNFKITLFAMGKYKNTEHYFNTWTVHLLLFCNYFVL